MTQKVWRSLGHLGPGEEQPLDAGKGQEGQGRWHIWAGDLERSSPWVPGRDRRVPADGTEVWGPRREQPPGAGKGQVGPETCWPSSSLERSNPWVKGRGRRVRAGGTEGWGTSGPTSSLERSSLRV